MKPRAISCRTRFEETLRAAGRDEEVLNRLDSMAPSMVTTSTDSDRAGDRSSRRLTSGGVVCLEHHMIKSWSSTQQLVVFFKWRSGTVRASSRVPVRQKASCRCSWNSV